MKDYDWIGHGRRLRVARLALGVTEKEAASAATVTLRTWRKWESGAVPRGNIFKLVSFADKYDVSLDWLITGDGAGVGNHLARSARGKIAILPAAGLWRRRAHEIA
jgi:transcriptional regulator with XRE-family HTH domain